MTKDQQVRILRWVRFHNPELLRGAAISKRQRLALTMVQKDGVLTSTQLARSFPGCAIREASRMLADLETKGYMVREKKADPTGTGGFIYEYALADDLKYPKFPTL